MKTIWKIWRYNGTTWSEWTSSDLTYDGTYASFTATDLSGSYAVVVPEPGAMTLLAVGMAGLFWLFRRRVRSANQ